MSFAQGLVRVFRYRACDKGFWILRQKGICSAPHKVLKRVLKSGSSAFIVGRFKVVSIVAFIANRR